jgi:hypothetical protein
MDKLSLGILWENTKYYLKVSIPIILLSSIFIGISVSKLPAEESAVRECRVLSKSATYGHVGNTPYLICDLGSDNHVNVFTPIAATLKIGSIVKVREYDRLFWYKNSYSYIDE